MKKFISQDQVAAVLGEVASGRSSRRPRFVQEAKSRWCRPPPPTPKVTETGDYVFRVCFIDPFQGGLSPTSPNGTLKAHKVAILSDVSAPYSVGLAGVL